MESVKLNMLLPIALFLLLSFGARKIQSSTIQENTTDMLTLYHFKHTITDPRGSLISWNKTTPFCSWNGLICSSRYPGRVVSVDLSGLGLVGQLSPSLGNLTFIVQFNLSSNSFFGPLPHLSYLPELLLLDLSKNSFDGEVPSSLTNLSNLKVVNLSGNKLVGPIPKEIGLLYNLVRLDLSRNNFTGAIPHTFKNTTHMIQLALQTNLLEGTIPAEIGTLLNLTELILAENRLSGAVPPAIFHLSSLQVLDLGSNMLGNDALPPNIGDTLPNLQCLLLGDNKFKGHIPASLGNALGLMTVDLSRNHFIGQVPSTFGKLSELLVLSLDNNKLEAKDNASWEFSYALRNCSSLQVLSIAENRLQGAIPDYVGHLKSLQQLYLSGNNLSGIVPPTIGNLTRLILLDLSGNNLAGTTETWVAKLKMLQELYLQENNFVFHISASIANLTGLVSLYLSNNNFDGSIPPSLGSLPRLLELDLSHNKLQGNIPGEVFSATTLTKCILSYNSLQGSIPLAVGKLTQLSELDVSSNSLTGEIPVSLEGCQELQIIRMGKNFLIGSIPAYFGSLTTLKILDLSHNNFSGSIPNNMNDLEFLMKLDLSYNNFQGEIPRNGPFSNATIVSLIGNPRLCGGVIDLHMPPCHHFHGRAEVVNYMVKIIIPIFGLMSLIMFIYIIIQGKKKSRGPYLLLFSFGKQFPKVSYKDLAQATGNFSKSNLIGTGSYGSVYKGKLAQAKMQVAIKVFDPDMRHADKSFVSECEVLRRIRHRNLLCILTACSTIDNTGNDFKALIYEFMCNGNLDTWLHHRRCLGLVQRINIAVGIADALAYLHHDCGRPIVHCDLKPTNILLDDDMDAHLGDFGIASLVLDSGSAECGRSAPNSSIAATGTLGYIAPEYAQSVHASTCGDVYSFGIVLLEMLIGKRPTDSMFEDELNIVNFVKRNFPCQMLNIIDAYLQEECDGLIQETADTKNEVYQCLLSLAQVALSCTRLSPRERMNMREVAINLHAIRRLYAAAIK
ncbi:unnamed protein product [Urochloa humidicola]